MKGPLTTIGAIVSRVLDAKRALIRWRSWLSFVAGVLVWAILIAGSIFMLMSGGH